MPWRHPALDAQRPPEYPDQCKQQRECTLTDPVTEPIRIPASFWDRDDVTTALANRDIRQLLWLVRRHTGASQTRLGAAVGLGQAAISQVMAGKRMITSARVLQRVASGLGLPPAARQALGLAAPAVSRTSRVRLPAAPAADGDAGAPLATGDDDRPAHSVMQRIRALRFGIDNAVAENAMSEASIEDWERTVERFGEATRFRSSGPLLADLTVDFAELSQRLARRQPISSLRRLTVVTAHMAGLMSLTLLKLNEHEESRNWARTARIAADEADEPRVRAWVRAQDAYTSYYAGSLTTAVALAQAAQAAAANVPCAGAALASALEARAQASLGNEVAAHAALGRTMTTLERLAPDERTRSAFGYDEAQLYFHAGNTLTHLHNTSGAWEAQQEALALYPQNDYMDRALINLDRATCLAFDGDISEAVNHASRTMLELTVDQRKGLITSRARDIVKDLTSRQRALRSTQDFLEIIEIAEGSYNGAAY